MLLILLSLFPSFGLKTGEVLYHIHCGASRDIGCTFALTLFVIFFPLVWTHWKIMRCGFIWFLFCMFVLLGPVWLLFFKTVMENSFWEQFLVFSETKLCLETGYIENSFCSKKKKKYMFGWVNKKKFFRTSKIKNIFKRFFFFN